jgi:hypothetical protein
MSKEFIVESTCVGCPFSHTDVDYDSVGTEYYHTCNLARFLRLKEYCTGVSTDYEDEFEDVELNSPEEGSQDIEWCPLKNEEEIIIKFKK